MPPNFPTSLDSLSNPTGSTNLNDAGVLKHSSQHTNINDIIEAIQAKLGIGASVPGATPGLLRRTATGQSAWDLVRGNDIAADSVGAFEIADNSILNGNIAAQTLRGGVDGAASRIAPASLTDIDLAAQTLRGGVFGAASRMVPGGLNYLDLAAGSACQTAQSPAFGQANVNPPWTWISGNAQVSLTTIGGPVLVIIVGSLTNNTAGTLAYIGHAQNSNTTANYTGNISTVTAGAWYPYIIAVFYFPGAGSYTWYGVCGTSSGSLTMNGYMMAIEFRR